MVEEDSVESNNEKQGLDLPETIGAFNYLRTLDQSPIQRYCKSVSSFLFQRRSGAVVNDESCIPYLPRYSTFGSRIVEVHRD